MPSKSWRDTLIARSAAAEDGTVTTYPPPQPPVPRAAGFTTVAAPLPFFNVRDFGAEGDGTTDDTAAIQATIAAAGAGGGIVGLAAGVYLISGQLNVPSNVHVAGAGKYVTIVRGGVGGGATFSFEGTSSSPVTGARLTDLTIDMQNVAGASGVGHYYVNDLLVQRVQFVNTAFKHVQTYVSTQTTLDNADIVVENCLFGATTATGTETVTLANTQRIRFLRCAWDSGGTQTDVLLYQLCEDASFVGCTFDSQPVYSVSCNNVTFDNCTLPSGIGGANTSDHGNFGFTLVEGLVTRNCRFGGALNLGSTRGYRDYGSTFYKTPQQAVGYAPTAGNIVGFDSAFIGTVFRSCDQSSGAWGLHYLPDSTSDLGINLIGCVFDDDQATPTQTGSVFNMANSIVYSGLKATDCKFSGGAAKSFYGSPGTIGPNCRVANNDGFNPVGSLGTVTVPASGTPYTNSFGVDATVYVEGGTVTGVAVAGTSTGATGGAFRVAAGQTITLTYSAAPTWAWFGH